MLGKRDNWVLVILINCDCNDILIYKYNFMLILSNGYLFL